MRRSVQIALLLAAVPATIAAPTQAQSNATGVRSPTPEPPATVEVQPAVPSLGRFFYSPSQRAALDEMRRRPQAAAAATETKAPRPPAPEYVTLNGIVRRSDGTTTVWLNDKQVRGRESDDGLEIAPARRTSTPNQVTVRIPQTGHVVDLKVGQQLEVNSGAVQERYRATPRPAPVAAASPAPTPSESESLRDRRAARERETLKELLREIDRPAAGPAASPEAKGRSTPAP